VTFLDVGQGDATFVRFPDGASMLIDAGGLAGSSFDVGARVVSPALWAMRTRRLSWLVLTHGDPDHVGGAAAVLEDFRPAEIWEGVPVTGHEPTARLRALAARRRLAWRRVEAGDVTRAGPVSVNVWHPAAADWERRRVRNDDSIVLELRHGEVSIVLPGDAGREVEGQIAPALARAGIRIVKAGHHGSAGATSIEWLAALRPQAVVVSAGRDNRFGHPAPAVLARCREAGAAVFRTDRDGAVQVVSSGRRAAVRMWDGSRWVERATYKASPRGDERGGPRRAETR
jgi:competence protein ComEC